MFYLTSKFRDNRVNTLGFMEGGELLKPPPGAGTPRIPGGIGLTVKSKLFEDARTVGWKYNCQVALSFEKTKLLK